MPLNLDAIGTVGDPVERSWTSKDALLYALGVGAGYPDPLAELSFTTENSRDVEQQVLPTFGVVLAGGGGNALRSIGSFNPAMLVHAEQSIELHQPLAAEGSILATGRLVDIIDKGSAALVVMETEAVDTFSGEVVLTTRSSLFIRGEGGFSAERGGSSSSGAPAPAMPDRAPDESITYQTLPHQALVYRLSGDRNPLHSDPAFAALAGFDRPILHGLCTYGFTGRALLHLLCDSDPGRFRSMAGRFSKPVLPGQALTVDVWVDDEGGAATFRTSADGEVVIDRGRCTYR